MSGNPEQFSAKEAKDRLQRILRGAFSGPPTPLKNIPKRNGKSRAAAKPRKKKKTRKHQ
jgi:hypothetical protein